jgi:hypothetical protein
MAHDRCAHQPCTCGHKPGMGLPHGSRQQAAGSHKLPSDAQPRPPLQDGRDSSAPAAMSRASLAPLRTNGSQHPAQSQVDPAAQQATAAAAASQLADAHPQQLHAAATQGPAGAALQAGAGPASSQQAAAPGKCSPLSHELLQRHAAQNTVLITVNDIVTIKSLGKHFIRNVRAANISYWMMVGGSACLPPPPTRARRRPTYPGPRAPAAPGLASHRPTARLLQVATDSMTAQYLEAQGVTRCFLLPGSEARALSTAQYRRGPPPPRWGPKQQHRVTRTRALAEAWRAAAMRRRRLPCVLARVLPPHTHTQTHTAGAVLARMADGALVAQLADGPRRRCRWHSLPWIDATWRNTEAASQVRGCLVPAGGGRGGALGSAAAAAAWPAPPPSSSHHHRPAGPGPWLQRFLQRPGRHVAEGPAALRARLPRCGPSHQPGHGGGAAEGAGVGGPGCWTGTPALRTRATPPPPLPPPNTHTRTESLFPVMPSRGRRGHGCPPQEAAAGRAHPRL